MIGGSVTDQTNALSYGTLLKIDSATGSLQGALVLSRATFTLSFTDLIIASSGVAYAVV